MSRIRILIAEDEESVRVALADLVSSDPAMEVVGLAADAVEVVEMAEALSPDVVILDVKMPGGGGPDAARAIRRVRSGVQIVAFSAYQDRSTVLEMIRAGAVGYVVKGSPPEELVNTIHRAVRGEGSLSVEVTADVIHELAEAVRRAEELADELRVLNDTKSELIQLLAHELFTPITSIHGFALTFAQRGTRLSPEDIQVMAEGVTRSTERLQRLVGNLRAAASLDRAEVELDTRPVAVRDLLGSVQGEFQSAGDRLVLPSDEVSLSARVWAVPGLAARALGIVVENALDIAPPDTPVELRVTTDGEITELRVADRGPGVPADRREKIFEAFIQADASATRSHEGLGIGLFLAKRVMQAHRGSIAVEDQPGGGSEFVLSFAAAQLDGDVEV
ncbi:MAG: response regulator [Actinobacteria bacterium]|nr:response regulator [Actinomycetota bacterium]